MVFNAALHDVSKWEDVDQHLGTDHHQMQKYIGERRGIQGHQNSCYLDATVFGLFALSDVFDSMFLEAQEVHKTADLNRKAIEDMLWKGIVNPLRKYVRYIIHVNCLVKLQCAHCRNGVVRFESVMRLRSKLDELGKMEGIAQDEKGRTSEIDSSNPIETQKYCLITIIIDCSLLWFYRLNY